MTEEEALICKGDPNLYISIKGKNPPRPTINIRIDPEVTEELLIELQEALGGFIGRGYNGVKATTGWILYEEDGAVQILKKLIWPLERTKTKNGIMKAGYAREVLIIWQQKRIIQ